MPLRQILKKMTKSRPSTTQIATSQEELNQPNSPVNETTKLEQGKEALGNNEPSTISANKGISVPYRVSNPKQPEYGTNTTSKAEDRKRSSTNPYIKGEEESESETRKKTEVEPELIFPGVGKGAHEVQQSTQDAKYPKRVPLIEKLRQSAASTRMIKAELEGKGSLARRVDEARAAERKVREGIASSSKLWFNAKDLPKNAVRPYIKEFLMLNKYGDISAGVIERTLKFFEFPEAGYPFNLGREIDDLILGGIPPMVIRIVAGVFHESESRDWEDLQQQVKVAITV